MLAKNSFSVGYVRTPLSCQCNDSISGETDLKTILVLCHSALKTASLVALKEWQVRELISLDMQSGEHNDPTAISLRYKLH